MWPPIGPVRPSEKTKIINRTVQISYSYDLISLYILAFEAWALIECVATSYILSECFLSCTHPKGQNASSSKQVRSSLEPAAEFIVAGSSCMSFWDITSKVAAKFWSRPPWALSGGEFLSKYLSSGHTQMPTLLACRHQNVLEVPSRRHGFSW